MILETLAYNAYKGKTLVWSFTGTDGKPVCFSNANLLIGKNSTGKNKTLSIINQLAMLLSQKGDVTQIKTDTWSCSLTFKEKQNSIGYSISVENFEIKEELITVNGVEKFNRDQKYIFSEKERNFKPFESTNKIVTSLVENNEDDYPYLLSIFKWGSSLKWASFTSQMRLNRVVNLDILEDQTNDNKFDSDDISIIFREGENIYGNEFINVILADMKQLDYPIDKIYLTDDLNGKVGISILEKGMSMVTNQTEMSRGMFRVLSFIIQINFARFSKVSACLLIDNMGEGLDFSRSKSLMKLLIYKINNSNIQFIITTNDKDVMNAVPIKYWSVFERHLENTIVYNYNNSKQNFDDFRYTGLNNFEFLETNFYKNGFEEVDDESEMQ